MTEMVWGSCLGCFFGWFAEGLRRVWGGSWDGLGMVLGMACGMVSGWLGDVPRSFRVLLFCVFFYLVGWVDAWGKSVARSCVVSAFIKHSQVQMWP